MTKRKMVPYLAVISLIVFQCQFCSSDETNNSDFVDHVIDGDTFTLISGHKVRLIGVDCPEGEDFGRPVEYFAREAKEFLERLISKRAVRLEYADERSDKYDRLLCYVWLDDTVLVNLEIVKNGYGMAYLRFPHRLEAQFLEAELQARRQAIGMWTSPSEVYTYGGQSESLEGLKAVTVDVCIEGNAEPLYVSEDLLRTIAELRLRRNGIKLIGALDSLPSDMSLVEVGSLSIWFGIRISHYKDGSAKGLQRYAFNLMLHQLCRLERKEMLGLLVSTWEFGLHWGLVNNDNARDTYKSHAEEAIDKFINDYLAANADIENDTTSEGR